MSVKDTIIQFMQLYQQACGCCIPTLYTEQRYEDWDYIEKREDADAETETIMIPIPIPSMNKSGTSVINEYNPTKDFHVIDIKEC